MEIEMEKVDSPKQSSEFIPTQTVIDLDRPDSPSNSTTENESREPQRKDGVLSGSPVEENVPTEISVMKKSTEEQMTLSWKVTAKAKPKKKNVKQKIKGVCQKIKRKKGEASDSKEVTILNNVTGVVKPGQICAIMGASGAGKTSLLNVLNFRNSKNIVADADIRINGNKAGWQEIAQNSGYVRQLDLFIGSMTVKEHLTFLSNLKLGREYTKEEKQKRVEEVIFQTNLIKAQDTTIGLGDRLKGISGGEKRRLAFASEIMTHKPILFCDEPTSGLDTFMADGLVKVMMNLAASGKTIICTIHQPSTSIFKKFDTLCLLSEGRVAYFGPREQCVGFFSDLGYVCPTTFNPADFYIKELAILPTTREASLKKAAAICDAFDDSEQNKVVQEAIKDLEASPKPKKAIKENKYEATFLSQYRWLLWRNRIQDKRQPLTKIMIGQVLFMSLFFGLIYLQLDDDEVGAGDRNGMLFILILNGAFLFLFPILNIFCTEMPIFYREHNNRMYSTFVYYSSKIIQDLPKFFLLGQLYFVLIWWMSGINNDFIVFIEAFFIFALHIQCSLSLGYLISAVAGNVDVGSAIAAPIIIPLTLFAGFFLNSGDVPEYFIWIKYVSWFFYTYDSLLIVVWRDYGPIACSRPMTSMMYNSTTTSMSSTTSIMSTNATTPSPEMCFNSRCYENGQAVLDFYSVDTGNLATNIIIVCVITVVLRLLGFIALKIRSKKN